MIHLDLAAGILVDQTYGESWPANDPPLGHGWVPIQRDDLADLYDGDLNAALAYASIVGSPILPTWGAPAFDGGARDVFVAVPQPPDPVVTYLELAAAYWDREADRYDQGRGRNPWGSADGCRRKAADLRWFAIEWPRWNEDGYRPIHAWGPQQPSHRPDYRFRTRLGVLPGWTPGDYWVWDESGDRGAPHRWRPAVVHPMPGRLVVTLEDTGRGGTMELTHGWITYQIPRFDGQDPPTIVPPMARTRAPFPVESEQQS